MANDEMNDAEFGAMEWGLPLKAIEFDQYGNIGRMVFFDESEIGPMQLSDFISTFMNERLAAIRKANSPKDDQETE